MFREPSAATVNVRSFSRRVRRGVRLIRERCCAPSVADGRPAFTGLHSFHDPCPRYIVFPAPSNKNSASATQTPY